MTEADMIENSSQITKLRQLETVLPVRMNKSAKKKQITDFFTK